VNSSLSKCRRAVGAAALLSTLAASACPPARADDVETLRSQAQAHADEVGILEHRLHELRSRRAELRTRIATTNRHIAALQVRVHDQELEYRRAMNEYVARAVEVYKGPSPAENLAIMLSARDFGDAVTFAKVASTAAEAAQESLATLRAARDRSLALQAKLDERKQELLRDAAQMDAIASDMKRTLERRRFTLARVTSKIKRLEARARRAAREAAAVERIISPGGPSPGIPDGFAPTGVSFEGIASWYGPGFDGNLTANGDVFDPDLFTAASRDLPLGSWLYVEHEDNGVVVYVNDRGPFIEERVLDLSQAAAEALGIEGLGWVRAEIILKL
jgi:rare lipoprotein A